MLSFNQRLGLSLFAVYLLFYGGFVLLSAFAPGIMETRPLHGINLSIIYGFGLINLAILLALIYGVTCHREDDLDTVPKHDSEKEEDR